MSNIQHLSKEEISVILEAISNISYVSPSIKSVNLINENKYLFKELIDELLICKKEETGSINKKYLPLVYEILEICLKLYSDDEMQTYTGQTRFFIQELIHKIKSDPR